MSDRLIIWDPETKAEVDSDYFAWGIVDKNSTDDKTFYVRNESSEYRAKDVTITSMDVSGNPGLSSQLLFSNDGFVFTDVLSLGDIVPYGVTHEITLRRVTRKDAVSGEYVITVDANSWVAQNSYLTPEFVPEIESDI